MVSGKPICRKLFGQPEHTFFHFYILFCYTSLNIFFWVKNQPTQARAWARYVLNVKSAKQPSVQNKPKPHILTFLIASQDPTCLLSQDRRHYQL